MKTVIEMAREAGTRTDRDPYEFTDYNYLSRFAEIVRADERDRAMRENAYVLAEREACAKLCDDKHDTWRFGDGEDSTSGPKDCAAAIRARGNT